MLKLGARSGGGEHMLILALTDNDIAKLQLGLVVMIAPAGLGMPWPGELTLVAGTDHADVVKKLVDMGVDMTGAQFTTSPTEQNDGQITH